MASFRILNRYSFLIVSAGLFLVELFNILKGQWSGDFWNHVAVVKALANDPVYPDNPIIQGHQPHPFYSPYALIAALVSKVSGIRVMDVLAVFGMLNLLLFLFSLHRFCKFTCSNRYNSTATLALTLILFFWGADAPRWSGFYHIMVLHLTLPYPSTFTMGLSLLVLSQLAKNEKQNRGMMLLLIFLMVIIWITHPTTAIFLFAVIPCLYFCFWNNTIRKSLLKAAVLIAPPVLLSLTWPYFSMLDLLTGNNEDFHKESYRLYQGIWKHYWPALLFLPAIFLLRNDRTIRFLCASLLLMVFLYSAGYFLKAYGLSRLISNITMFAQIGMAYVLTRNYRKKIVYSSYVVIVCICFCLCMYLNRRKIYAVANVFKEERIYYNRFEALNTLVQREEVILSHPVPNMYIPAYRGKVLATNYPLYWVDDHAERRKAVWQFFDEKQADSIRLNILLQYRPDYILIDYAYTAFQPGTLQLLRSLGEIVYSENYLELIRLRK